MSGDKGVTELQYTAPEPLRPSGTSTNIDESEGFKVSQDSDAKSPLRLRPFSVFTRHEQWAIVIIAGFAALFSPLTANVYLPAIPAMADAFNKSVESINLTVTVYMVVQGLSPVFWGTLADKYGRRPIMVACLLILSATCVGLAVIPTSAYWLLMVLRCIQAAGSASTVAVGSGVIADIATRADRGTFLGLFSIGILFGPSIGPVLGGVLAQSLGWRSIFWFIAISSGICFLFLLLFFPETLRSLVGDGSIPAPKWDRPIIPIIGRHRRYDYDEAERPPAKPIQNPLLLFKHIDVDLLLFSSAIVYAVFYGVTTTIAQTFGQIYPSLSETEIGLCFLAIGGGAGLGSFGVGRTLDWDFARVRKQYEREKSDIEKNFDPQAIVKDEEFPIEEARLRLVFVYLGVFSACCIGYGWALDNSAPIVVPLILQIILGYSVIGVMNPTQALILDLFPEQGSSITACNNVVRCLCGATLVSVINLIVDALGNGKTFTILGAACVAMAPAILLVRKIGPRLRKRRDSRGR